MCGHYPPALGHPHPGLHLAADAAAAFKVDAGRGVIAAECRDHLAQDGALKARRGSRGTKLRDLVITVKQFGSAVADGVRAVLEQLVEDRHIVADQRLLIAAECRLDLGQHFRNIDIQIGSSMRNPGFNRHAPRFP